MDLFSTNNFAPRELHSSNIASSALKNSKHENGQHSNPDITPENVTANVDVESQQQSNEDKIRTDVVTCKEPTEEGKQPNIEICVDTSSGLVLCATTSNGSDSRVIVGVDDSQFKTSHDKLGTSISDSPTLVAAEDADGTSSACKSQALDDSPPEHEDSDTDNGLKSETGAEEGCVTSNRSSTVGEHCYDINSNVTDNLQDNGQVSKPGTNPSLSPATSLLYVGTGVPLKMRLKSLAMEYESEDSRKRHDTTPHMFKNAENSGKRTRFVINSFTWCAIYYKSTPLNDEFLNNANYQH